MNSVIHLHDKCKKKTTKSFIIIWEIGSTYIGVYLDKKKLSNYDFYTWEQNVLIDDETC